MTRAEHEQEAAIYGLVEQLQEARMEKAMSDGQELLTAMFLAQTSLMKDLAQAHTVMAESIVE